MKVKAYLFAILLCYMLPVMVQGTDLDDHDPPEPPPRTALGSVPMSPVRVETQPGMLPHHFSCHSGKVCLYFQEVTRKVAFSHSIDPSVQSQAFFAMPAGTHALTITDAAGKMIRRESIIIS